MTVIRQNNAEGGTNGTNVTVPNSGGASGDAWTAVNGGTGVWTYTNSPVVRGGMAYQCSQAASTAASLQLTFPTSNTNHYGRIYFYYTGFTTGSANTLLRPFTTAFGEIWRIEISITGQIRTRDASLAIIDTSTPTINLNSWYRIEWHVVSGTGTSGSIELYVYPGDSMSPLYHYLNSACNTGSSTDYIQFGPALGSSTLPTAYFDEMFVDDANYPGPANISSAWLSA